MLREVDEEFVFLCKISFVSLLFKGECKSACALSSMWFPSKGGAEGTILGLVGVSGMVGGQVDWLSLVSLHFYGHATSKYL